MSWIAPKVREKDIRTEVPIVDPISRHCLGHLKLPKNKRTMAQSTIYVTYRVDFSYDEAHISEEDAANLLGENFMESNDEDIQVDNKEFSHSSFV